MPVGVLTVSEITAKIKWAIQFDAELQNTSVQGEISNLSRPSSGHLYFTLKDERARLRVVMFASKARFLRFQMKDGMRVIVRGSLDVFERSGDYQLYADAVQPDGIGALYMAFEQLKAKLEQEGWFRAERKRALPTYPGRVALVTSATGAAVRDMITTLRRRYPLCAIVVVPVAVQGEEAPTQIAAGIRLVHERKLADVMIVGRGGGSFEELFAYNTEVVARAIIASEVPVISAVGHETDTSIADFVADVRAATPTAAAELVAPSRSELVIRVDHLRARMQAAQSRRLAASAERLQRLLEKRVLTDPMQRLSQFSEQVDRLEKQLKTLLHTHVQQGLRGLNHLELRLARVPLAKRVAQAEARVFARRADLERLLAKTFAANEDRLGRLLDKLTLLNPLAVMRRGYAVVYERDRRALVTTVDQVQLSDALRVELIDGWLECQVRGVHESDE